MAAAFESTAFESTAFEVATGTGSPAFDGGRFNPLAFYATTSGSPSLAFDGCSFNPLAFDAAPCGVAVVPGYGGRRRLRRAEPRQTREPVVEARDTREVTADFVRDFLTGDNETDDEIRLILLLNA